MIFRQSKIMNSKAWADQLMSQGRFDHAPRSERNGAGENLAGATGMSPTVVEEAVRATQSWYNELHNPGYNFNNPGWNENPGAGHFTQV